MAAGVRFLTAGTCVVAVGVLEDGILGVLLFLLFAKLLDIAADILCGLAFLWSRGATAAAVILRTLPAAVTPVVDGVEGRVAVVEAPCSFALFNLCSLFAATSLHSGNSWACALKEALF